jgi:integrase
MLNFTFGKTLRGVGSSSRPFTLLPTPDWATCPVFWFRYYLEYCRSMRVTLHPGYVFRATVGRQFVSDQPFVGSAVHNRLRSHLRAAGMDSGETPHSFRTGMASTLSLLGYSADDIARYVGWKSVDSARHYTQPVASTKLVAVVHATGTAAPLDSRSTI